MSVSCISNVNVLFIMPRGGATAYGSSFVCVRSVCKLNNVLRTTV